MSNRKLILAYVCLVGIPLLSLIGIVRSGQHLQAPISVGGNWNVEADLSPWSGKPCVDLLSGKQPLLSISQSGDNLTLLLNNPQATVLAGTIRGTALRANTEDRASDQCSAGQAIAITAEVSKDGERRALTGAFRLNRCRECAPVSFHALRLAALKKGEP